jgi:hypothetical protein
MLCDVTLSFAYYSSPPMFCDLPLKNYMGFKVDNF